MDSLSSLGLYNNKAKSLASTFEPAAVSPIVNDTFSMTNLM
jgi:hypothetical protein